MQRRTASLYKRDGKIIICANARGPGGVPVDSEPFQLLEEPVAAGDLGKAVREALAQFRDRLEEGPAAGEFLSFFAQLAGVDTYAAFMADALYVAIEAEGDTIVLQPMLNDEGALTEVEGGVGRVSGEASREAVGRAAVAALAKAG